MGFAFGSFDEICKTAALIVCPLLGPESGISPTCYSRNVEISSTIIFQPVCVVLDGLQVGTLLKTNVSIRLATCFMHIVALIMVAIMVFHVRCALVRAYGIAKKLGPEVMWSRTEQSTQQSARKEIILFFYLYAIVELLAIFLDSGVIPTSSTTYPVRLAPRLTA